MEFNQRVPRYLDGDIQIGWVAQRGMLDVDALRESFGFTAITREGRVSRGPRFTLVFYVDAPELVDAEATITARNSKGSDYVNRLDNVYYNSINREAGYKGRKARGKIVLQNCKLDTFAIGVQSGQKVVANQWEGLAEGYILVTDESLVNTEAQSVVNTLAGGAGPTLVVPDVFQTGSEVAALYD
jgi:hypothetical protein